MRMPCKQSIIVLDQVLVLNAKNLRLKSLINNYLKNSFLTCHLEKHLTNKNLVKWHFKSFEPRGDLTIYKSKTKLNKTKGVPKRSGGLRGP